MPRRIIFPNGTKLLVKHSFQYEDMQFSVGEVLEILGSGQYRADCYATKGNFNERKHTCSMLCNTGHGWHVPEDFLLRNCSRLTSTKWDFEI